MTEICKNWDYAIENGGFYFQRAKSFNLPLPPLCFVDKNEIELTNYELELVGRYHELFKNAEVEAAINFGENDD